MDYDLLVIGAGAAGLTAAGLGAGAGAKTLLVEAHRAGGDCTWTGCIPSKALLHSAEVARTVRRAADAGIRAPEPEVDFAAVMARVRRLREAVYEEADAPPVLESHGVEVAAGRARFVNPHTVEIDGDEPRRVTARRVILATGGRPAVPDVEGLAEAGYLTSETLFELDGQPRRLAILGAGPIGVEMAQAFARLGTEVTVVEGGDRILSRDDPGHADALRRVLDAEGVRFAFGSRLARVEKPGGALRLHLDGRAEAVETDALLVAAGREPNVEGLGLERAGVAYTAGGITVDERCRTSAKHVWAAGDCTGEYQLTHMSEHMAKVAATNAVLRLPMKLDRAHVPWVTFTDPELATVGAGEAALEEQGATFEVYRFPYDRLDRAITDGAATGEIRVFATPWTGKILGASVLGARGGEVAALLALAMKQGVPLRSLSDTILPYPTYALGARRAADQWYVRRQTPGLVRLLQRALGYRGPLPPPPDPDRIV